MALSLLIVIICQNEKKKSFNIVNSIDTKQTCLYKDIKTLMPRQNGWQFADNNLKYILLNENI